jgi:hypothetical protein
MSEWVRCEAKHCTNLAKGIYEVTFKVFRSTRMQRMKLCAECGMYKMARHTRYVPPHPDNPDPHAHGKTIRDVTRVNLLETLR